MSKLSWLALGVGAYLAFTVVRFPASTAYRWFAPPSVSLSGVAGTIWSGSASLGSVGQLPFRDLRWQLDVGRLVLLTAAADVETRVADGFISTGLAARGGRVEFAPLQAGTSIAGLSDLLPVYGTRGQISANLERLVVADGWPVNAAGEVRIGSLAVPALLASPGRELIDLGDFAIRFSDTNDSGLAATVTDLGGPLELAGNVRLNTDRSYLLDGRVRARPTASEMLLQGLSLMTSEPDADGWRRFEFPGSL